MARYHFIKHFKTITKHRHQVIRHCFNAGIGFQGLFHDLSKYMPAEFIVGAKYYRGDRSPNEGEREDYGYSKAWMHHKGRNKHHFEYWSDYNPQTKKLSPIQMPKCYVIEMFCDRVAAEKIYKGDAYSNKGPLKYFNNGKQKPYAPSGNVQAIRVFVKNACCARREKNICLCQSLGEKSRGNAMGEKRKHRIKLHLARK